MARIELAGVRLSIHGRRVLGPIDLVLEARRIGVVGLNGSGKSTLLRLIAGLVAPDAGRVRVNGIDVARDRRAALSQVGILFQNPDHQIIFPTVAEEIAFGLSQTGRSRAGARAEAIGILSRFGREDWAERAVATLSQGQRHLVCLMSILAMAPRVILLDEPFGGLDIPTARALHRVVASLDAAVVHVTHDPGTLSDYDRVVWIEDGRLRMEGAAHGTLARFATAMEAHDALADL